MDAVVVEVIGGIVTVGGFYLVNEWNRHVGRRDEILREHFLDIVENSIKPITSVIDTIGVHDGQVGHFRNPSNNGEFLPLFASYNFETGERYNALKAHYPDKEVLFQEYKMDGLKHNRRARAFEEKLEKQLRSLTNLPIRVARMGEEMVIDQTPKLLEKTLYQMAYTQLEPLDFNSAEIEQSTNCYVLKIPGRRIEIAELAYTSSIEQAENCRSALVKIQGAIDFRAEAQQIAQEAGDIRDKFYKLSAELKKIKVYGLATIDNSYRFKPNRNCPICKELFY